MRSAALLSLLFILTLSDGAVGQETPYARFKKRHILPIRFNINDLPNYLWQNKLCIHEYKTTEISLIRENENDVIEICSGAGEPMGGNYYRSRLHLHLYSVTSYPSSSDNQCIIYKCTEGKYLVTVACNNATGEPVHYETQSNGKEVKKC